MTIPSVLARSLLSADSRQSIKQNMRLMHDSICQNMRPIYHSLAWLTGARFGSEILRLEKIKNAASLGELGEFSELKSSAWLGLDTLAYQIVLKYRPKVIVELGTYSGLSALAMALALRDLGEGGQLFAIDCWEGDANTRAYGADIYETFLRRRAELKLESTIVPLKMYFDEARDKVATPIDLLHIDGLHTWDAVNHDWETFGPLVKPGGLVMFHDVNTQFEDLRRFWAGLSKAHESHLVPYSHGLGIIRTATG